MLPFTVSVRPGIPVYEQVIYAVCRAVVTRQLRTGDPFPSVRDLSRELAINPNTAHKIVARLVEQGLLVVQPGVGTIVSDTQRASAAARKAILAEDAERLVVEARRAGVSLTDLLTAIRRHWARTVNTKAG